MKVHIQKKANGEWLDINCFSAMTWFIEMGYEIVPFVEASKIEGLEKSTPVVGGIGSVKTALARLGCPEPVAIDFPDSLKEHLCRKIWTTTLGDIHVNENLWPVFIKPKDDHKRFTGHVVRNFADLYKTVGISFDMPVYASEVVTWQSEYRCFILNKEILDIRRYAGDMEFLPNLNLVRNMIEEFTDAPVAYSLDVGKMLDSTNFLWDTSLIEVNDGFSLGIYGLPAYKQVKMIIARWKEMTSK
jgi:hypothetical protein